MIFAVATDSIALPRLGDDAAELRLAVFGMGVSRRHGQIQGAQGRVLRRGLLSGSFSFPFTRKKSEGFVAGAGQQTFGGRAAEQPEQRGGDKVSSRGQADQAGENHHGDRMQDLGARLFGPNSRGASAKAATSAVISTGVRRSSEPRTIIGTPKTSPSSASGSGRLILRMPLRVAMPASDEADQRRDRQRLAGQAIGPSTLPTRAKWRWP